jgi:plasmid stabilization system protein ParE
MRVELASAAEVELADATAWYLAQGLEPEHGLELAERFVDAVERGMRLIAERPQLHPEIEPRVRRAVLRGFPYSLIYAVEPNCILVMAVMHHKRSPGYWRGRSR